LPPDARHVLQCAAVVGTDFPVAVLAALAALADAGLAEQLRLLQDAELVYASTGAIEPTYRFKHPLTHLVTYRSLPPERQRALHGQALRAIEALYAAQLDAQTEALAEHAFRGEAWEKAGAYLHAAGVRARVRSANRTMVEYLERAIVALDRAERRRDLRERAIDVRLDLRYALLQLGYTDRVLPHLREAETIAGELDDTQRLGRVVSFLANGLYVLGDHDGAIASARRAREIAARVDDFPTRVTADIYAGRALYTLGRFREANELFRSVVDALRGEHANDYAGLPVLPSAYARSYLVMGLTELGEFESALAIGREAVAIAEGTRNPDSIQWACYALGNAALERGDVAGAIASLERALSICRSAELPVYVPRTAAALGHAYALAGRADGVVLVEEAAAGSDTTSQRNTQARIVARLAEVYVLTGKWPDAAERAARALALARARGERASETHALRALAAAHARESRADESRSVHETALSLAEELGMRPVAALCHLGLGTLGRAAGRVDEAARHLDTARAAFAALGMARWEQEAAAERALLA
jgi:tetratricopeptide (TPR) repeat protein